LKTLNACPQFVLSIILLEHKQKFKHGGVDKCDICMASLKVLGSSLVRINLHYFAIYVHISPIMLGFSLSVFLIADFHISSQVLGEKA